MALIARCLGLPVYAACAHVAHHGMLISAPRLGHVQLQPYERALTDGNDYIPVAQGLSALP